MPNPAMLHVSLPPCGGGLGRGLSSHNIKRSRDALAPEFCQKGTKSFASKLKGGEAPKGASSLGPRHTEKCCHSPVRGRGSGLYRSPLAFRRSTAALVAATERFDSAQAVLHAIGRVRALPAPSIALKRSTPRAGRNAGGNDARTAREQGYKPCPQEPHSPHPTAVTGRRP
jgi:hypothetical protein